MYAFGKILKMDTANLCLNPVWVMYGIGFPMALVLVMGFLTRGAYGDMVSSFDYYGVSLMVYCIFNCATYSANSFLEERIKRPNLRILYAPVHPSVIHLSKTLATTIFCTVCYCIAGGLLHLLVGANYGGENLPYLLVLLLLGNLMCAALGVTVCCIVKSESIANQIMSLLITVFALLGGVFFRVEGLGAAMATISWFSPAKWLLTAAMQILYDGNLQLFLPACAVLLGLTIVCEGISMKLFKGEAYL